MVLGGIWIADGPGELRRRWTLPGWVRWVLMTVFAMRMGTAALLVRRATRRGGVHAGAVLAYLGAWLAGTASGTDWDWQWRSPWGSRSACRWRWAAA